MLFFLFRAENNQLKDIKFDFIPGSGMCHCTVCTWPNFIIFFYPLRTSDNADSIAKDLVSASLIDGRNLVVGKCIVLAPSVQAS
jgi:hypothetical protein